MVIQAFETTTTQEGRQGCPSVLLHQRHGWLWRGLHSLSARCGGPRRLILALALSVLVPTSASAQTEVFNRLPLCTNYFLSACATLRYLDFSNTGPGGTGVLTIIVENSSFDGTEPGAYIKKLRLDTEGVLPGVATLADENYGLADAQYGAVIGGVFTATDGDTEKWKVKNEAKTVRDIPGFLSDLTLDDNAKEEYGGNKDRRVGAGEAVMITVSFAEALPGETRLACSNDVECRGWTAEMKGMGLDGKGKGYTTTPEPSTWLLLASGLGLLGVAGLRRRRETPE